MVQRPPPAVAARWESVIPSVGPADIYVVQRYVERPMLWEARRHCTRVRPVPTSTCIASVLHRLAPQGKFKFHFRVYCVLTADMRFVRPLQPLSQSRLVVGTGIYLRLPSVFLAKIKDVSVLTEASVSRDIMSCDGI